MYVSLPIPHPDLAHTDTIRSYLFNTLVRDTVCMYPLPIPHPEPALTRFFYPCLLLSLENICNEPFAEMP